MKRLIAAAAAVLCLLSACEMKKSSGSVPEKELPADEEITVSDDADAPAEETEETLQDDGLSELRRVSKGVLYIIDEPESGRPCTFILMRAYRRIDLLTFTGIPTNTAGVYNGSLAYSLQQVYDEYGAEAASVFVKELLGTKVNKYIVLDRDAFLRICTILGSPEDTAPMWCVSGDICDMPANEVYSYISGGHFSGGEPERAARAAELISALVNGSDRRYIVRELDAYAGELSYASDTDITSQDYEERSDVLKSFLSEDRFEAAAVRLEGFTAGGDYIADPPEG